MGPFFCLCMQAPSSLSESVIIPLIKENISLSRLVFNRRSETWTSNQNLADSICPSRTYLPLHCHSDEIWWNFQRWSSERRWYLPSWSLSSFSSHQVCPHLMLPFPSRYFYDYNTENVYEKHTNLNFESKTSCHANHITGRTIFVLPGFLLAPKVLLCRSSRPNITMPFHSFPYL